MSGEWLEPVDQEKDWVVITNSNLKVVIGIWRQGIELVSC